MHRSLSVDIEIEDDRSATVSIFDNESGLFTTEIYDENSCDNGAFEKWLVDEVLSWITLMQEEMRDDD